MKSITPFLFIFIFFFSSCGNEGESNDIRAITNYHFITETTFEFINSKIENNDDVVQVLNNSNHLRDSYRINYKDFQIKYLSANIEDSLDFHKRDYVIQYWQNGSPKVIHQEVADSFERNFECGFRYGSVTITGFKERNEFLQVVNVTCPLLFTLNEGFMNELPFLVESNLYGYNQEKNILETVKSQVFAIDPEFIPTMEGLYDLNKTLRNAEYVKKVEKKYGASFIENTTDLEDAILLIFHRLR